MFDLSVHLLWQLKEQLSGINIRFYLKKIEKLVTLKRLFVGFSDPMVCINYTYL